MQTIEQNKVEAAAPTEAKRTGLVARIVDAVRRVRGRVSGVLVTLAFLVAGAGVGTASATTGSTDPTGGAGDTFFTSLTSYLTGHLIAAVLALAVIGVSVSMLLSWGKKAAKSK